MRKLKENIQEVKLHWKNYVFQSLFAGLAVFLAIIFLSFRRPVVIASLGATAFVIFAMPKSVTAHTRNVFGGYLVGLACGFICSLPVVDPFLAQAGLYALAVGLAMLFMVILDVEHPPACAIALAASISGLKLQDTAEILISVVVLLIIRFFLKSRLRDLV